MEEFVTTFGLILFFISVTNICDEHIHFKNRQILSKKLLVTNKAFINIDHNRIISYHDKIKRNHDRVVENHDIIMSSND